MKEIALRRHRTVLQIVFTVAYLVIASAIIIPSQALAQQPPQPLVAIHVSELTQALETMPAVAPTPTGSDTSGYEWWYTSWHYFVGYESLKDALRSDGTPFVTVSDSDISSGLLLNSDGSPRYPIVISLASEAISNTEVAPLRAYVNAGGFLFIGSSSFTRNPNGTTREDFALASEMGLHMTNASLLNWYLSQDFTKTSNHRLTSHIPSGTVTWSMPLTSDQIPWGADPATNSYADIHDAHYAWQVGANGATVLANGNAGPLLTVKSYGQGQIIWHGDMQPLIGHGGFDPGMYAYLIYRRAIEWAFQTHNVPIVKLSPWRYPYDAALMVRHDFENDMRLISSIQSSAQFEKSLGTKGDYYFSTGALRTYTGSDRAAIISSLRSAVSNYGATIGSHNGGLKNPVNSSLTPADYPYWHWGPDEALDQSPSGYASGRAYASASILTSFQDIEGWLSGVNNGRTGCGAANNCPRTWASPFFNSTREPSMSILQQLGSINMGEQKISPFPHWTLSYNTSGMHYSHLSVPVSDWYVDNDISQRLETHTTDSIRAGVDFFYTLGALINFYGHEPSNNGQVHQEYVTYSITKPALWSTNTVGLYDWWSSRSNVVVTPTFTKSGAMNIATASLSGATDSQTAVEIAIPTAQGQTVENLAVLLDNTPAASSTYRTTNYGALKVMVGASVSNVQVEYVLAGTDSPPVATNDTYTTLQNTTLNQVAPGVLGNDTDPKGATLTAQLVSNPSHGALTLNTNGSFTYTPTTGYVGSDSFTYVANDGTYNGNVATVTITVLPTLTSISLSPTSLTGGSSSQGTVTLSGAAPTGGAVVTLSDDSSAATTPTSVTVAAGSTSATFTITTTAVTSTTSVTISAVYSGVTKTATLTINPAAVSLSSLSLSPTSLTGGSSSQGTVTLSGAAPTGGVVVTLSDDSSAATTPTSVTVAAGSTSATFTITTTAVTSTTSVTISAVYSGVTKTATLTINRLSLSTLSLNPTSVTGGASSQGTVTLSGAAPTGGVVVSLSDNSSAATTPTSVTVAAGSTSATFTITTTAVTSTRTVTISAVYGGVTKTATLTVNRRALSTLSLNPTSLTGGSSSQGTVTLSGAAPTGGVVVTLSDDSSAATTPTSVTVAAGSTSATFTITTTAVTSTTSVTISAVYSGVTKTATLTVNPAAVSLSSLSLSPTSLTGGSSSQGTVTLSGAAPTGGAVVTLSDDSSAATTPTSVTVAAGSTSATFTITTTAVTSTTSVTISAVYSGVTKTATLTVNPAAVSLSSLSLSPTSLTGGSSSQGTVTLSGAAPTGGVVVTLSDDSSAATTPTSVTVAAGSTSATFTITTTAVTSTTSVTISAVYSGVTKTATLTVNPAGLTVDVITSTDAYPLTGSTITTSSFSTEAGNELLLAFISASYSGAAPNIAVTGVSGGGLTWTLVRRTNTQEGDSEIWRAFATTALNNAQVTASMSRQPGAAASITVVAFAGVNTATPVGAVGGASASTGVPTASLTTQGANSFVFGVGNDWDGAVAHTVGANQTMVHQYLSPSADTFWVQRQNATVQPAGTVVTINGTAPTDHRWNLSIVEVRQ